MTPSTTNRTGLGFLAKSILEHRLLISRLAKREFQSRFRGHLFGIAWAVVTPLITALVFTFVFSTVFRSRWGSGSEHAGTEDFAIIFLAGLAVHTIFAEAISRAPSLIVANSGYATRVVFPLEILPIVTVISALVNASISLVIVLLGNLILNGILPATVLFLPFVVLPYLVFVTALVFLFAAIGTYVRDISQILGLLITASLFLTPIFYPIDSVPSRFQFFVRLNPLTTIVEQTREVLLFGHSPDFFKLGIFFVFSVVALAVAFWIFQRLRAGFSDVL